MTKKLISDNFMNAVYCLKKNQNVPATLQEQEMLHAPIYLAVSPHTMLRPGPTSLFFGFALFKILGMKRDFLSHCFSFA